ncbi:fumarylacetoacetate hydrolase family protein [Leeia sp. TBRC 13508]|uniref:Fumarylacetoacetate hydrolase family protein n=1 Tax=Leeia speluncae TaxID=2884804 RepID=A0ABS8D3E3_9NEIS|nr:fumarylacetoacetate hydrolase family protein [Leeia speluncae]MCB6182689.1 fumarylacetoacetate hydrolase family protein [Leeia speluncae]
MKLATLKNGGRDGTLVVVSKDLQSAVLANNIAATMQYAMDHWDEVATPLADLYEALNSGKVDNAFAFHPADCHSPLPRAYQWADGSAYVNHVELVRKARGADMPPEFWHDPLMYQGGSDSFVPPTASIDVFNTEWGVDLEGEVAVITGDVPMGSTTEQAASHIRLLMLVNDVTLRNLIPAELAKGFGFFQSKPATAFSPVAITPDELGTHWQDSRVTLPLSVHVRNELFGQPDCGTDMVFNFADLIAHVAKTRELEAGSIVGSGTISNVDRSSGSACIVEKRMLETIETGKPVTPYLQAGDTIRIEMFDEDGHSLFGAIEQVVRVIPRP